MTWTASKECADVSYEVARERAPQAGVPLQRPTETIEEYLERTNDPIEDIPLPETYAEAIGLDDYDVVNDR
jgi:hypothetical protein